MKKKENVEERRRGHPRTKLWGNSTFRNQGNKEGRAKETEWD